MSRKFLNDNYYYVTSNTGTGLKANEKVKQTFFWIEDENSKLDKLAELLKTDIDGSVISKHIILFNLPSFQKYKIQRDQVIRQLVPNGIQKRKYSRR